MITEMTEKNKSALLLLARCTIAERLGVHDDRCTQVPDISDPLFSQKLGAFVTLHMHGKLRGCIGYIQGYQPLAAAIHDLAESAAFRDPRFAPLSVQEYPQIDIEISVLSPIEPLDAVADIVIGRDGLIISKGRHSGLLLPQVAAEYGWSVDEFLSHTCMKAGLDADEWKTGTVRIERFSAFVFGEKQR
ncbi:MAG: AmmeMemoRadiSam system protein A [Spirochaetota bacterium]